MAELMQLLEWLALQVPYPYLFHFAKDDAEKTAFLVEMMVYSYSEMIFALI